MAAFTAGLASASSSDIRRDCAWATVCRADSASEARTIATNVPRRPTAVGPMGCALIIDESSQYGSEDVGASRAHRRHFNLDQHARGRQASDLERRACRQFGLRVRAEELRVAAHEAVEIQC